MKAYSGAAELSAVPLLASICFHLGKQNWGRLGKRFLKSGLKRQFLGEKQAFMAVFQNLDLPLTPSFVGSNPATPANTRAAIKK